MEGVRVASVHAGAYAGPIRGYANIPALAADVTAAILDSAEAHGRLEAAFRPEWEAWAAPMIELTREAADDPSRAAEVSERLAELGARPLPDIRTAGAVQTPRLTEGAHLATGRTSASRRR
jgi:hypothetical protein